MSEAAVNRRELWGLSHYYYGEAYFGSYKGMRYRVAREPLQNVSFASDEEKANAQIKVSIWKEPYAYGRTPKEDITDRLFEFSEEGMQKAVDWLNYSYNADIDIWKKAYKVDLIS